MKASIKMKKSSNACNEPMIGCTEHVVSWQFGKQMQNDFSWTKML